ncbi:response regulator transcription factor [Gimibacter soli]|uniref:Response regulator n=1 Tax=Gimibacter soli TaxID=3024400 RepID=A0AAF0BG81_9PROT|nr:response regulator [Gimibacter soli]WCL53278.1 response regulator [Gimibacter soli]
MPDPRISVIDDDDSLREALVGLLRSCGFEATGFASAEAFLATETANYACIVTDIHMSGMSGFDLLKALGARQAPPAIMITARLDADLEDKAKAAGALCLLRKPFASDRLLDCIDRALAR